MNTIYLRRKNKVIIKGGNGTVSLEHLASMLKNLEDLGYTVSDELLQTLSTVSLKRLAEFYNQTIDDLKVMVGAHVQHNPMYPNFPEQVMNMSEAELYFNAMVHYFGAFFGVRIIPRTNVKDRENLSQDTKLTVINRGSKEDFYSIFTNLVSSNTSLSVTDKKDINWFIKVLGDPTGQRDLITPIMPANIPLRENVALMAGLFMERGLDVSELLSNNVKTSTDVLRIAVQMSDGDVSLADACKFKNFKRSERRMLLSLLDNCKNITEDMIRYTERWKRLGERLHPFENKNKFDKVKKAFNVLFNKEPYVTFGGKVEQAIADFRIDEAVTLLKSRPGEYARRLDNLIRLSDNPVNVVSTFGEIAEKVSTPVLLQVKAHFSKRHESNKNSVRTFFPKGNISKLQAIDNTLQRINPIHCKNVVRICDMVLRAKFADGEALGKVYLDKRISGFNVPFSQRSASESLRTIPRGSSYDLADGDTVRFFIHWKDIDGTGCYSDTVDVDLSAVFLDENHKFVQQISYTNSKELGCYYSGDLTSAPNGASEYIDISIEKCLKKKIRYVVMSVNSYSRQSFTEIPECFAGVMMREEPQSGEVFEPKTVDNRLDLTADNKICIPMIIDLEERKVIWTDLGLKSNLNHCNNVHGNMSSLQLMSKAMTSLNKPNLYDLLKLHVEARKDTEFVDGIEDADTIFSIDKGITPFDVDIIVSEYIK